MKVAHVVLTLDQGGLEHLVIQMSEQLQRRGIRCAIVVLTDGTLIEDARRRGIDTFALHKRDGFDLALIPRLRRLLRTERVDVVHSHNFAPLVYGTLASRLAGLGTVNTRHGRAALGTHAVLWALTHHVVAVSEDARRELLRNNRISPDRVQVILNGIDLTAYRNGRDGDSGLRSVIGVGVETPLIGTVGRLAPEKDHATLLAAFRLVCDAGSPAHLVIIGGGPLARELEARSHELALTSRVHFLGFRSDIPALLRSLDVFVLPSITEGISLTLIEAMAAGLPVVATRVGGNPEVVVQNETGFLVPARDPAALTSALDAVLSDPGAGRTMGQRGRRRAERVFDIERVIDEYVAIYEKLVRTR